MKKILIILLILSPLYIIGQKTVLLKTSSGKLVAFQTSLVSHQVDTTEFAERMSASYLSNNSHFSTAYAYTVNNYILDIMDENYVMPDASDNWYTRYKDSTNSNWFHILSFDDDISLKTISKSGATLVWQLEESIYTQDNLPNHTYTGDGLGILTSPDGWSGVTGFRLDNNNFVNNISKYDLPNTTIFYCNSNTLDGTVPSHELGSVVTYYHYSNNFDSIGMYANSRYISAFKPSLSTALGSSWWSNNSLDATDIDKVLEQTAIYFSENTPIKNLNQRASGNVHPTCGIYNSDYLRLQDIYTDAGYAYSWTMDAGNTGTLLNRPRITLPDTMYVTTGTDMIIYDDAVAQKMIGEYALNIDYTCAIGSDTTYGYKFSEVQADTGYYQLIVEAKQCATVVDDDTCIVRLIKPANGTGTKTILNIGNSLTNNAASQYTGVIRTNLTGITADMVGTQGTAPNEHEGRSGWAYATFLGSSSPFWNVDHIDFNNYRANTLGLGSPIDIVAIQLGINDLILDAVDTTFAQTELLDSVKSLVDYILADGTGAIIIALTPSSENTGDGWWANYTDTRNQNLFIEKIHAFWESLNNTFSGKKYANNVYISHQGMTIDRNNGYIKDSNGIHTNGVHPATSYGYGQLANTMTSIMEAILKGE